MGEITLPSEEEISGYDYYAGAGSALKAFLTGVKKVLSDPVPGTTVVITLKEPRAGKGPGRLGKAYATALVLSASAGGPGRPTLEEFAKLHNIPLLYDTGGVIMKCCFNAIGIRSEEILDGRG